MANKRPKPEEIVSKLRQVEVSMGQGMRLQLKLAGICELVIFFLIRGRHNALNFYRLMKVGRETNLAIFG